MNTYEHLWIRHQLHKAEMNILILQSSLSRCRLQCPIKMWFLLHVSQYALAVSANDNMTGGTLEKNFLRENQLCTQPTGI